MAWPSDATKVHLDAGTDDPKQARSELADLVDKFNLLLDEAAQLGGANTFTATQSIGSSSSLKILTSGQGFHFGTGGDAAFLGDLEFPDVSTANATLRLFRATNTSGTRAFDIYDGDGSATRVARFLGGGGLQMGVSAGGDKGAGNINASNYFRDGVESTGAEIIRKTADETVNNSSTLQNDDHLLAALAASETIFFHCLILHSGNATADIKMTFTVPTGATYAFAPPNARISSAEALTMPDVGFTATAFGFAADNTNAHGQLFIGVVRNGGTPGNLQLQWAQSTATVVDTKVLEDSFLMVWRV